jgi:hypothetical protein
VQGAFDGTTSLLPRSNRRHWRSMP